jgi:hypothetical protein
MEGATHDRGEKVCRAPPHRRGSSRSFTMSKNGGRKRAEVTGSTPDGFPTNSVEKGRNAG